MFTRLAILGAVISIVVLIILCVTAFSPFLSNFGTAWTTIQSMFSIGSGLITRNIPNAIMGLCLTFLTVYIVLKIVRRY